VATFPVANAFAATQSVANRSDSVKLPLPVDGIAFYSRSSPTNVYLAFPGSNYQIEVFDPNPQTARSLVEQGVIQPVSWRSPGAITGYGVGAASVARLKTLSSQLGHPVYWAGTQPGTTYELTQTANGRVFVRYLPAGAKIGATVQYPFVGTLPVPNALAATTRAANQSGSVKIQVGGDAVAFYSQSRPTNIYLAYPGSNYQIEVFNPNPQQARSLVSSGRILQIS
jgi:hypothetical protein